MFREITRVKNKISIDGAKNLLKKSNRGVLSFNEDDEYPYSIPMNYYYDENDNKLYFHSAKKGYKIDCINKNSKSCFVTFGDYELSDYGWSHYISSVIVFGRIEIIEDEDVILNKIREFDLKYYPSIKEVDEAIKKI